MELNSGSKNQLCHRSKVRINGPHNNVIACKQHCQFNPQIYGFCLAHQVTIYYSKPKHFHQIDSIYLQVSKWLVRIRSRFLNSMVTTYHLLNSNVKLLHHQFLYKSNFQHLPNLYLLYLYLSLPLHDLFSDIY